MAKLVKDILEQATEANVDTSLFEGRIKLDEMNKKHAFVNSVGGRPMVLCSSYSEVYKRNIREFRTPEAIMLQYSNQTIMVVKRNDAMPIKLGKWWVEHSERNEFEGLIFDPKQKEIFEQHGKRYLNLWEGFGCEAKRGCWKHTLKHIKRVLCNNCPIKFKYVIRWIAWLIQNPGTRAEVAIIFKGKKGAGKGFIFTQLVQIFGRHGMSISNRQHLTGKHNAHLQLLAFLFADEAYYPGDKEVEGCLKQLITEPYLTIEPKFQQTKLGINCLHIGMSTNNEWVIPAESDERRYFINEVDNDFAKGQIDDEMRSAYFKRIWGEMDNGGREALLYDLQRMNLGEWHPRYNIPETKEMRAQIRVSMRKEHRVIHGLLMLGVFPGEYTIDHTYLVSSSTLNDYLNEIDPFSRSVSMVIKAEIIKKLGAKKVRRAKGVYWEFPPLDVFKNNWNNVFGDFEWPEQDVWETEKGSF